MGGVDIVYLPEMKNGQHELVMVYYYDDIIIIIWL